METKEYEIQIKAKHTNGIQSQIQQKHTQTMFQLNSEFGFVLLNLVLLLWDLGEKDNCLQKATVQSPWTTNGMATTRNVGTTG